MNSNVVEYCIGPDGSISRRQIITQDVEANEAVINALTTNAVTRVPAIFDIPEYGSVNMSVVGASKFFTVPLTKLTLRAPYKVVKGVAVPEFKSRLDPVMPLVWVAPDTMRLRVMVMVWESDNKRFTDCAWLFALDKRGTTYRLPVANVYNDCKLCLGTYAQFAANHRESVINAMVQLDKSTWNADLMSEPDHTQRFFRWKVVDDGFEQMPPDVTGSQTWTALCDKVAVDAGKFLCP